MLPRDNVAQAFDVIKRMLTNEDEAIASETMKILQVSGAFEKVCSIPSNPAR